MLAYIIRFYLIHFLFILAAPLSHAQQIENSGGLIKKEIFSYSDGKGLNTTMYLLLNGVAEPVSYTAHVITYVCSDGLCKPIDLNIFWDLLGNFESYETTDGNPLTKFDHIPFTADDHKKLQKILEDRSSILKDYEAEEMVDSAIKVHSSKLDAVTGATSRTFQDVVVPGAVYTVHRIWRIVNGPVSVRLLSNTKDLLDDKLIRQLLRSGSAAYKDFIFNNLQPAELSRFRAELIALIGDQDIFVPHLAMSKLTDQVWNDTVHQEAILSHFQKAGLEVKNAILSKFAYKKVSTKGLQLLIAASGGLNKAQLNKLEAIFENNKAAITEELRKELLALKTKT